MHLILGIGIVIVVTCLATWVNDTFPVGDYIEDEQINPS